MNQEGISLDSMIGLGDTLGAMTMLAGSVNVPISGGMSGASSYTDSGSASATAIPPAPSIQQKMQQEIASSEPNASSISSPELSQIASETYTQTELNEKMVELLTQIKEALGTEDTSTPSGGMGMDADTSARKVRNKPFMNTKWAYGAFVQTSGKQVTNIGSGTK